MKDKKVLFVSSEIPPYMPVNQVSESAFHYMRKTNSKGVQVRVFMPRYGIINYRTHQLHEVQRLSGINLNINDMDMHLMIKVATIPKERMQVYFIDNDELFKRKAIYTDSEGEFFKDNDQRAVFFAKGVIETIKKLNWPPDIIHVHGWMASFLPMYLKSFFNNEPLLSDTKIVTSIYDNGFKGVFSDEMVNILRHDGIPEDQIELLKNKDYVSLMNSAIDNSDACIISSPEINTEIIDYLQSYDRPILNHKGDIKEDSFLEFYEQMLEEEALAV